LPKEVERSNSFLLLCIANETCIILKMVDIRYREKSNADVEGELGGWKWPDLSREA
jgi:hypothetical protein